MQEEIQIVKERYELTIERISSILEENTVPEPFDDYFRKTASFLLKMKTVKEQIESGAVSTYSLEQWQGMNHAMYEDILPKNYHESYGNPDYAVERLGEIHGRILSFLYTELRGIIVYVFEERLEEITILQELFIEIYNCFEEEELPSYRTIQQIVYWFVSDYSDLTVTRRVREAVDPALDFAVKIVMEEDLQDLRYLYKYGEYISENEIGTARHLNKLPEETIKLMASTYTEGYRIGFELGNKDLSKKKTVNIRYQIGFERMIRQAVFNFEKMGLKPIIYRAATASINKRQHHRIGYCGGIPNKQFDYDHRADNAIYLDKPFVERKLGVQRTAYEKYKEMAYVHGGPACVETFGEEPFVPCNKESAYHLSPKQQQLCVYLDNESVQITNRYIRGEERSFTIIAFPIPEIGDQFAQIFDEVVKINTLDYQKYSRIQQTIIEALDRGSAVHIEGQDGNHTDLTVQLHTLKDAGRETNFENCVADVNIPVGEVFTSPVLTGTEGTLHVSHVYLDELEYKDLTLRFEDGRVTDYSCANFTAEEENRKLIKDNILFHHETLPIGEFAIGTNTTAFVAARKYHIEDKLPILIAEKTGPHFAVGDTCYSHSEEVRLFNPDGKEIIAKDNECSIKRKEDSHKAYFNCHTDITIPYDELGEVSVVTMTEEVIPIIEEGRFVLAGCEELNAPFDQESMD